LFSTDVQKKKKQIEQLRKSLAAHIAHATATNSRLTLALDTLDSVQCDHAFELAAEIQAKERLRDTLTRYLDIVKVAEIERDDLRDAVIELAEKSRFSTLLPVADFSTPFFCRDIL
jgi:hypothetical protein